MKVSVVIPAYNESRSIETVIRKITGLGIRPVVVDDGSTDNTAELARQAGAEVLQNKKNEGKGKSLIKAFNYALKDGADVVICMDGDGQHCATDIPSFIKAAKLSDARIFIGNRMSNLKNMPFIRIITNKFMSWLISCLVGQNIPDTQCGFRLIRREVLEQIDLKSPKFEIESEILIKAAKKGFRIESIPIKTIYADEKSQINPFKDTLRFIRFIIREIWTTKS